MSGLTESARNLKFVSSTRGDELAEVGSEFDNDGVTIPVGGVGSELDNDGVTISFGEVAETDINTDVVDAIEPDEPSEDCVIVMTDGVEDKV